MREWQDLINLVNYLGAKIESSNVPDWIKWPLVFLLVGYAFVYIVRTLWNLANSVDKSIAQEQGIDDYAEASIIFDERIKNESNDEKKAALIKERDETLGKLEPK